MSNWHQLFRAGRDLPHMDQRQTHHQLKQIVGPRIRDGVKEGAGSSAGAWKSQGHWLKTLCCQFCCFPPPRTGLKYKGPFPWPDSQLNPSLQFRMPTQMLTENLAVLKLISTCPRWTRTKTKTIEIVQPKLPWSNSNYDVGNHVVKQVLIFQS